MVSHLFEQKDMTKKEAIVRAHYEASYRLELRKNLTPEEIDMLYKQLMKLRGTAFIYHKKSS